MILKPDFPPIGTFKIYKINEVNICPQRTIDRQKKAKAF